MFNMNSKTCILFLLLLSFYMKSQSWCPPGAIWYYGLPQPNTAYSKYTYMYDTIVGTDVCQKLATETHGYGMGGNPINYYGAIYTKFQNGIVFKNNGTLTSPQYDTLYYFNGSIGAIWRCQLSDFTGQTLSCSQSYIEITDTGTTVIQGQSLKWRKIFYKNYYNNAQYSVSGNDTIFERMGTRHNMEFISGGYCGDITDIGPNEFRCYSDVNMSVQLSNVACDYTTGVKENNWLKEIIISNPVDEILTGSFFAGNYNLKLIDVTGKIIYVMVSDNKDFTVNVQNFPSGIYYLQIQNSKSVVSKKILIQH